MIVTLRDTGAELNVRDTDRFFVTKDEVSCRQPLKNSFVGKDGNEHRSRGRSFGKAPVNTAVFSPDYK